MTILCLIGDVGEDAAQKLVSPGLGISTGKGYTGQDFICLVPSIILYRLQGVEMFQSIISTYFPQSIELLTQKAVGYHHLVLDLWLNVMATTLNRIIDHKAAWHLIDAKGQVRPEMLVLVLGSHEH